MRCEMAKVKSESLDKLGTGSSTVRLRSPQASRRMTSEEQKLILEKLSTLEELLKKKDDRPLTFKEACTYLGYAPSYLYKLTYKNVIPHYKPTGKMIFFSKNEVDQWIFRSNSKLRIENSELKDDGSAPLTTKDPNQMEIFNRSKGQAEEALGNSKEAMETEVVIEFPLKSRRKK